MTDTQGLQAPTTDNWDWQLQAACRGMDSAVFFHPPDERGLAKSRRVERAKAVCGGCPALMHCREHALRVREPYGVWGGLSEEDRAAALGLVSIRYPQALRVADPSPTP